MKKKWTDEQIQAIKNNKNIFISASAGSGKTSVLVERVIHKIFFNKNNITDFLILTYTKKGANEIKLRLLNRLYELYDTINEFNIDQEHLLQQIILISDADITTIHAFCLKLITENNSLSNNINEIEINNNIYKKINIFEKEKIIKYFSKNKLFKTNIFIKFDDFLNACNIIYLYSRLNINPLNYLLTIKSMYNYFDEEKIEFWSNLMNDYIIKKIMFIKKIFKHMKKNFYDFNDQFLELEINIENLILHYKKKDKDFINYCEKIINTKIDCKSNTKNTFFKNIINDIFKELKLFLYKKENIVEDMQLCYYYVKHLIKCIFILYKNRHFINNNSNNIQKISFSDIEHITIDLIKKNILINVFYKDIIIDEYQDTSEIQEFILNNIKCENYFYVGDLKQCIYEFRSASTNIFKNKLNQYLIDQKSNKYINLNKNFRTTKKIIRFINNLFLFITDKKFFDINYENEMLLANDNEGKFPVEINILTTDEISLQMKYIADKIYDIIQNDDSIKANDIVILFRNINDQKKILFLEQFLIKYGIDIYYSNQNKFLNQIEIKTIINFLKIVNDPHSDLHFIGSLLSPLFSFNINDILKIQLSKNDISFYEKFIENINDKKHYKFIDILNTLRTKNLLLSKLINEIYILTSAMNIFGSMINGDIRQKNLTNFILYAQKYDNRYDNLSFFLEKIDEMINNNEDFFEFESDEKKINVIKVMSIHQSKGLEFPIVILGEVNKKFNINDLTQKFVLHKKYGIGFKLNKILSNNIYDQQNLMYNLIIKNIKIENTREELRILYVACTRAIDRLIIVGQCKNIFKKIKDLNKYVKHDFLKNYAIRRTTSFLMWIILPYLKDEKLVSDKNVEINIINKFDNNNINDSLNIINEKNIDYNIDQINIEKIINNVYIYDNKNEKKVFYKSKITASDYNQISNLRNWSLKNVDYNLKLGNEYHKVIQYINFKKNIDFEYINSEIKRLTKINILDRKLYSQINSEHILSFFKSNIYYELSHSNKIWREFRFSIMDNLNQDSSLLQGIIDLVYIYNNKINIIDFKTDKVAYEYNFYKKKYLQQLNIYQKAIFNIFKMQVDKKILYFFYTNEYICL